jgi:4-hydroxy-4-methyl-2-oxoglutarate aldolase
MGNSEKKTLGKLPPEAIRMLHIPRLAQKIIDGFRELVDLTGTTSDAMDQLGLVGTVSAFQLPPVLPGTRVVGPAVTLRNVQRLAQVHKAAQEQSNTQGETEAHNLAVPGDVLVIEGVVGCSNMGGQSATLAQREGFAGAVVDGTVRDPDHYRASAWPTWCRGFTPITGKYRMQTIELNGTVHICGVQVRPGDLVCADEAGVCFVPFDYAAAILEAARKIDAADTLRKRDIDQGVPLVEILQRKYK